MSKDFVHLHLHTEYSFLDGMTRVWDTPAKEAGELIHRLHEIGQTSCAITDHGSTSGWVRFDKACNKNDIKPIFGVEGYYCNDRFVKGLSEEQRLRAHRGCSTKKEKNLAVRVMEDMLGLSRRSHFCALAMNKKGSYEIQVTLSSAFIEGFYRRPRWDWDLVRRMNNCLFLSGCAGGILGYEMVRVIDGRSSKDKLKEYYQRAWDEAKFWKEKLGDRFYIELMAIDMVTAVKMNWLYYKIAKDLDIPVVMTNDSHYARKEDWESHDILLAINSTRFDKLDDALTNPNRLRYDAHDLYIKSYDEMYSSFRKRNPKIPKEDVLRSMENTVEVAEKCKGEIIKGTMIMPALGLPNPKKKPENELQKERLLNLVKDGWKRKVVPYVKKKDWPEYQQRIKDELVQIIGQGFTPYFILCNDLMHWIDEKGIERGPARGSSCGSLVAYLLDITMVDPIPHKLLFSRFIDPNRTDYPDVDMDFEDRRRREVVDYFRDKYGKKNVAILGNNMTFKAKMSLKDVARLYHVPIGDTQKVCNLVIERSGADSRLSFCLEDTLKQFDFAKHFNKKYPKVFKFAGKLEGGVKQQGVHAAAVVIGDGDIRKFTALRTDKKQGDLWVTTMDKHDAEDVGLLKMDVLGLNTMTIINECKRMIKDRHDKWIDLEELTREVSYHGGDPKVYKAFANAETVGIFQFNSQGLTRLSKQARIERFSEISDATALHRPGPIHSGAMNNYPAYKFGKKKIKKAEHPIIDNWTKDTYGLIIYQEQVMQIVRELGDFDWAQTNTVRKVMSKSGGAEYFMKTFWPQWKKGCNEKGLDDKTAEKAFKRIMSFGSWAFNKSHSCAYAFVSYYCMWLKVNYPIEYITAYLNTVSGGANRDQKIKEMIKEAGRLKIPITEPDVNISTDKFEIDGNSVVSGLSDIKSVGVNAVKTVVENRPYNDLIDFILRINNRACNKRAVEHLIMAGAFDRFGYNKKKLLEVINPEEENEKKQMTRYDQIHKWCKAGSDSGRKKAEALLEECTGKEQFSDQEVAESKSKVSPITVGKHLSEYYDDVINEFAPHISITKLVDIEMDEGKQQSDKRKRLDVNVIGVVTQVDLKRLSQEVKDVIKESEEQRYALANLEDSTDFIVLSLRGGIYNKYEQMLHKWIGKVLLVRGTVNEGWKKIYVTEIYEMDALRAYIKSKRKPYDFAKNYLFQHPLTHYFSKYGGIDKIRKRVKCVPLIKVLKLASGRSIWALGIISDIQTFVAKKGKIEGKEFHCVYFEDDTFQGSFMLFPTESRYDLMKKDLFGLWKRKEPFLLRVQRDLKYEGGKSVSITIDKRIAWKKMIKKPFKFKKEK